MAKLHNRIKIFIEKPLQAGIEIGQRYVLLHWFVEPEAPD